MYFVFDMHSLCSAAFLDQLFAFHVLLVIVLSREPIELLCVLAVRPKRGGVSVKEYAQSFTSILTIFMSSKGLSFLGLVFAFSMASTTSLPFMTLPNTVCLPSSQGVGTVVMKNWLPAACAVTHQTRCGSLMQSKLREHQAGSLHRSVMAACRLCWALHSPC